mmetsp:Transcript_88875/g.176762  ORF Transcript_88875/g.176762 Transcript_88875/m.176762 type:complete len:231 (-) Transcript_88875:776-1468(-)
MLTAASLVASSLSNTHHSKCTSAWDMHGLASATRDAKVPKRTLDLPKRSKTLRACSINSFCFEGDCCSSKAVSVSMATPRLCSASFSPPTSVVLEFDCCVLLPSASALKSCAASFLDKPKRREVKASMNVAPSSSFSTGMLEFLKMSVGAWPSVSNLLRNLNKIVCNSLSVSGGCKSELDAKLAITTDRKSRYVMLPQSERSRTWASCTACLRSKTSKSSIRFIKHFFSM